MTEENGATRTETATRITREMEAMTLQLQSYADAARAGTGQSQELWGTGEIGELLGVKGRTVAAYRVRYEKTHPCPKPDFVVGKASPVPCWWPARKAEWLRWDEERTGRWPAPTPEELAAVAAREAAELEVQIKTDQARIASTKRRLAALKADQAQVGES